MTLINTMSDELYSWRALEYQREVMEINFNIERKVVLNNENYNKKLREELELFIRTDPKLTEVQVDFKSTQEQNEYRDFILTDNTEFINLILYRQRCSSVLSAFALIEGQLKNLCNLIQEEFGFQILLKNLRSENEFGKYKLYLEKVFGIDFISVESYFSFLDEQKYVRNKIAHNDSLIELEKIKLIDNTFGLNYRKIGGDIELEITDSEYIELIISNGEMLIKGLIKAIDKRYDMLRTGE